MSYFGIILLLIFSSLIITLASKIWIKNIVDTYNQKYFFNLDLYAKHYIYNIMAIIIIILYFLFLLLSSQPWQAQIIFTILLICFAGIFICDYLYQIIPDRFHVIGGVGAIALNLINNNFEIYKLLSAFTISLVLVSFLVVLNFIYFKIRSLEGLGFGDIKFIAWLTLLFNDQILNVMFLSFILALVFFVLAKYKKHFNLQTTFAFGPFLIISALINIMLEVIK